MARNGYIVSGNSTLGEAPRTCQAVVCRRAASTHYATDRRRCVASCCSTYLQGRHIQLQRFAHLVSAASSARAPIWLPLGRHSPVCNGQTDHTVLCTLSCSEPSHLQSLLTDKRMRRLMQDWVEEFGAVFRMRILSSHVCRPSPFPESS